MKIAVSGSQGFVGSSLCKMLRNLGHEVLPVHRMSAPVSTGALKSAGIAWVPEHGLVDPKNMNGIDALIHLAGKSIASGRWTTAKKQEFRSSRVLATRRLAEQLIQLDDPPRTIISASAIGIYGDHGSNWVNEHTPQGTGYLPELAADWETACDLLREAGLRVVHPRLGLVLDRSGGALAKMLPLFQAMLGGRLGDGRQYWSWISLDDCCRALLWLLDHSQLSGPFNIVASEPVTNLEFTKTLAKVLSRPALIPVPGVALRLALGEMAESLLLSSCRVSPSRLLDTGFQFQFPRLQEFLEYEFGSR